MTLQRRNDECGSAFGVWRAMPSHASMRLARGAASVELSTVWSNACHQSHRPLALNRYGLDRLSCAWMTAIHASSLGRSSPLAASSSDAEGRLVGAVHELWEWRHSESAVAYDLPLLHAVIWRDKESVFVKLPGLLEGEVVLP